LELRAGQITQVSNLVIGSVSLVAKKSIGDCGCMSAEMLYRSIERRAGFDQELASGLVTAPESIKQPVERWLVLSADGPIAEQSTLTIRVGCSPPQ
jgi:hypothetical protein